MLASCLTTPCDETGRRDASVSISVIQPPGVPLTTAVAVSPIASSMAASGLGIA